MLLCPMASRRAGQQGQRRYQHLPCPSRWRTWQQAGASCWRPGLARGPPQGSAWPERLHLSWSLHAQGVPGRTSLRDCVRFRPLDPWPPDLCPCWSCISCTSIHGELERPGAREGTCLAAPTFCHEVHILWEGIEFGRRSCEKGLKHVGCAIVSRYAARFLAVNGAGALTSALGLARPPGSVIRYAMIALEAATRACGAAGCEIVLGWWAPPLPQLKAEQEPGPGHADGRAEQDVGGADEVRPAGPFSLPSI